MNEKRLLSFVVVVAAFKVVITSCIHVLKDLTQTQTLNLKLEQGGLPFVTFIKIEPSNYDCAFLDISGAANSHNFNQGLCLLHERGP